MSDLITTSTHRPRPRLVVAFGGLAFALSETRLDLFELSVSEATSPARMCSRQVPLPG